MLKKILMVALLAITTHCYIAAPAEAGNSIRLNDTTGGGTNTDTDNPIVLCSGEDCIAGDELIYNAVEDCWDCCAGPGCGDIVPCDPTACEEGDCLNWNDTSSCFECNPCPNNPNPICPSAGAGCAAGEELVWDPVNECWDCCANPPGPCDIVPCDPENCQDGDYLVWDPVGGCFACVPPDGPPERRFLYRDQADTFTPIWWVISGDPDADFGGIDDDHHFVVTPQDNWLGAVNQGPWLRISGTGSSSPGTIQLAAREVLDLKSTNSNIALTVSGGKDVNIPNGRLDLSGIDHGDTTIEGLILPQNTTAGLTDPTGSAEGYIAWSTDGNALYCNDGTTWAPCGGSATLAPDCTRILAAQLDPIESAPMTPGIDSSGTNVKMRYARYSASTDQYGNYQTIVPDALAASGNVTITIWTRGDGTADASGLDVIWSFDYSGRDDGETYDGAYTSSAFAAETYLTTDDTTLFEVTQTIATSSFTAGDLIFVRFWRDADNGSDTYDGNADILEAEICWAVE